MKLIRFVFISLAAMFVIGSLIGFLLPSHVLVSRAVNINASRDSIMGYIKDIEQWKWWMDGMRESAVKIHSSVSADLNGTNVQIRSITDSTVQTDWQTRKGHPQTSTIRLIGNPSQNITVVQWQFEEQLKWYPWERLGSMMNDKILGPMMETNLNNLKKLVEGNKAP